MMISTRNIFTIAAITLLLAACAAKTPAPVVDRGVQSGQAGQTATKPATGTATAATPATPAASAKPLDGGKTHTVQKGDTLYSIAFQNNLDYKELASWNNIENQNVIKVGDVLRLTAPTTEPKPGAPVVVTPLVVTKQPSAASERPAVVPATTPAVAPILAPDGAKTEPRGGKVPFTDQALARLNSESATPAVVPTPAPAVTNPAPAATPTAPTTTPAPAAAKDTIDWAWPVKGKVITNFTELNKGIDISGAKGVAVNAAAAGTVIHTGAGIRGYGRLVIIKHSTGWVSAYAHNDKITVMEGQEVKRGQKVAEMGNSDADQVKLHFEIRRQGKPVDPITLLPKQ